MIITKTPFRISFFGGGTDYPEYFEKHGGAVLATAIDHSAFLSVSRFYSRLFDYNIRVSYRQVECVNGVDEIQHPGFRECLRYCGITQDLEVNYTADLPSFSGVGSSSSFMVGLLNALHAFQGRSLRPLELAYRAIELERGVMKECVGCQDQALAAVGGFSLLEFRALDDIVVHRIPLPPERLTFFEQHLLLLYTGVRRRASEIAARQVNRIAQNLETLRRMREMVDLAYDALAGCGDLETFGKLLDESWRLKQTLDDGVAGSAIRELYDRGLSAGAFGGKLLGAGGGGFLLFFVPPERRQQVRTSLCELEEIPLRINAPGSHILHA
jgi:D-glycero-alpha-D-manno-heptose-7-phosphate kinase